MTQIFQTQSSKLKHMIRFLTRNKKILLSVTTALFMTLILSLTACTNSFSSSAHKPADSSINTETASYWADTLSKYRDNSSVNQLLLVRYTEGCKALTQFFVKYPDEGNAWSLVFEDASFVGLEGQGEADSKSSITPTGDFKVLEAFGIRNNPGTSLPYIKINDTTYACGEADSTYFNTIIDTSVVDQQCGEDSEHMIDYSPQYNYGLNFDYNPEKNSSKGCAFFIHCKGVKPYTGGCVALDEDHMKTVLQQADSGMRIVINKY